MQMGDVYSVELPGTNGHEQMGTRPAIIVQTKKHQRNLPTILVVPLASKLRAASFPFTFTISPDKSNGLAAASVALVFRLRAIDQKRLCRRIGKLGQTHLTELRKQREEILELA